MKRISILFWFVLVAILQMHAQTTHCGHAHILKSSHASRLDSMDIVSQHIYLDFSEFTQQNLSARTVTTVALHQDLDSLHFDFEGLIMDSVVFNGVQLPFNVGPADIWVLNGEQVFSANDTISFGFYYHGTPVTDASWGGFYYNSLYAYNMGVGFGADPHCFGRVWHPCIDDFNDRVLYQITTETLSSMAGYAGGILIEDSMLPNGHRLMTWQLNQSIPSYLASVAVANYVRHESEFLSEDGATKPIWLVSRASDTLFFKNSLIHLPEVLSTFETAFGPYPFDRVGYVAVPFSGGAMEHATNIAYPLFAINGNLAYETLYAHELSHMWWGDAMTCSTQEDMWLNEGWASYCESLALEGLYGADAYWSEQKALHKEVITQAHVQDGGYWPVSGVPHGLTYGTTVYRKGAWVVHNLRTVMGDSAFFAACREYQSLHGFESHTSEGLRDFFQGFTNVDLSSFFDTHLFHPGFLGFQISQWNAYPEFAGGFVLVLKTRQGLRKTNSMATSIPLKVSVLCDDGLWYDQLIHHVGMETESQIHLPAGPVQVVLNRDNALHHAVLGDEKWVNSTGSQGINYPEITLVVNALSSDSAWVRAENHLVGAEFNPYLSNTDWYVSPERFVQLYLDTTMINTGARWNFNSTSSADWDSAFFANVWAQNGIEDSIHLLYKGFHDDHWQLYPYAVVNNMGSPTSGSGRFELSKVLPGSYTWGFHTGTVHHEEMESRAVVKGYSHNWVSSVPLELAVLTDLTGRSVSQWKNVAPGSAQYFEGTEEVYLLQYQYNGKWMTLKWKP